MNMNSVVKQLIKLALQPAPNPRNFQNVKNEGEIIDEDRIIDLSFDKLTKRLTFKIQHYHLEPKISRYVQRDYQRFPVYEGEYSERTRIIKTFNKIINPIKFVNDDMLAIDLTHDFMLDIIEEIGIVPAWRKKEIKIENFKEEIKKYSFSIRDYEKEEKPYSFMNTRRPEVASNFWLRLLFVPITFGFSFKGYITKKQAELNMLTNRKNQKWNEQHQKEIDQENENLKIEIEENNEKISEQILRIYDKIQLVESQKISYEKKYADGWFDIKSGSNAYYPDLENQKGVYIIWNKTKNKYYVGQSKNIKSALLGHFKDGEPKNIIFAKDWLDGDNFVYKYYFCDTKDELDRLKKQYIEEYFAFENGYNKTRGNI